MEDENWFIHKVFQNLYDGLYIHYHYATDSTIKILDDIEDKLINLEKDYIDNLKKKEHEAYLERRRKNRHYVSEQKMIETPPDKIIETSEKPTEEELQKMAEKHRRFLNEMF